MGLLSTGVTALNTSQSSLATVSHNISNVNTEGYSRQRVDPVTRQADRESHFYIGNGVKVRGIERLYDEFLASQKRTLTAQQAQYDIFKTLSSQLDNILDTPSTSLSKGFDNFFNAANGVVNNPTSLAARQVLISASEMLVNRFTSIDSQLDKIKSQLNGELAGTVEEINVITKGIAELNSTIISLGPQPGGQPNDLLDQRDRLIDKLSEYVSVSTVEDNLGAINVFIGNGQALVVGTSQFEISTFNDNSTNPPNQGIAYSNNLIKITDNITGGSLGGALQARKEVIDSVKTGLNNIAEGFVEQANKIHRQGVTLDGSIGGLLFNPASSVTAANISVAVTNPRDIAAAFPAQVRSGANNTGTGEIEIISIDKTPPLTLPLISAGKNIVATYDSANKRYNISDGTNSTTIAYNVETDSGKTYQLTSPFAELTIKLTGVPANSDTQTISNSNGKGDNRNALALVRLQNTKVLENNTQSLADAFDVLVTDVANKTSIADINQKTQQGLLDQVTARVQSISGVNLDEEAANLIRYQQSYQAASQIITVSNTIFNSLLNVIGR